MARILVIARQIEEGRGLARLLQNDGHFTAIARTSHAAAHVISTGRPDMMVLALHDPSNMITELAHVDRSKVRRTPALAVMRPGVVTEVDRTLPCLLEFIEMPFSDDSFLARVDALLRVRGVLFEGHGASALAEGDARVQRESTEKRGALRVFMDALTWRPSVPRLRKQRPLQAYIETASAIVDTIERRDAFDPGHAQRVVAHCASIAELLGLEEDKTSMLLFAASVHDIGKIVLAPEVLLKPRLTEADRKMMKFHPKRGAELIRALTPYEEAADAVFYHHERPDGKGYYGYRSQQIPPLARILAVAEVYEGMTSGCHGSSNLTQEQAIESLRAGRGLAYDAECVDAMAAAALRPVRNSVPVSVIPGLDALDRLGSGASRAH